MTINKNPRRTNHAQQPDFKTHSSEAISDQTIEHHILQAIEEQIVDASNISRRRPECNMVRLPDELWAQIWECIPVHETPMKIPFPFVATWVCTSWRRIALGTPCLWGNVRISIKFPVQLLKLQLERCLPCCITIELDLLWGPWTGHKIQYRSEDKLALAISLLSNNVERCRAFELRAVCFDVDGVDTYRWLLKEIMRPLITARAPHLERLYIQCPEEDHPGPLFAGGIPRLTDLTLLATQCTTYLPLLHGLVSLELSCIPHGNALTPSDFQNTLAACPNLTHLAIRNQCITYDHLEGRALILPFHLPSLVSLSVELHHVDRHFARHFFEGFSAPHLESLHLHHFQWESYRAFVVAMCKDPTPRFPNLSKLSLFDVDILHTVLDQQSRNYCLKLLLCFPSIKELVIHTYDPGDSEFLHLLATHRKELLCPKLCSLSWLRQFPLEHEESLLRGLISSRALLGSPIFKLSYFRDAFADLDSETQDWLHQNTRVELRNPVAFVEDL